MKAKKRSPNFIASMVTLIYYLFIIDYSTHKVTKGSTKLSS